MSRRVLHILNTSSYSGAENVIITLIEGFRSFFSEKIDFVYVSYDGSIREVLEKHNISFEPIYAMSLSEIKRVKKKYKPDIIHAHDFTASIICAAASGRTPVISHIHNNSPWIKKLCINSITYGLSCIKYKKILGVSASVFDEYVFGELIRTKAEVIGNPIDVSKIQRHADEADDNDAFDVVFLGRLSEQKDPMRFIDIINDVKNNYPDISAVMVGDGVLRQQAEEKIQRLNLGNNITLKGFVSNPYGILKNSKMLCIPSKWEGFGLVAVEALALGKPVLAAPAGGLPGIVTEACGGVFGSDEEFADEIVKLLEDEEYLIRKENRALERAEEIDNIEEYIEHIGNIYGKMGR